MVGEDNLTSIRRLADVVMELTEVCRELFNETLMTGWGAGDVLAFLDSIKRYSERIRELASENIRS